MSRTNTLASVNKRAKELREANKRAVEDCTETSDLSDLYTLDTAFVLAADIVDHVEALPLIEQLVPDHPKHSNAARAVPVRLLLTAMIALALTGRAPHLTRVAAVLCSHKKFRGSRSRVLRKKTRRRLGLAKNGHVSRAMVQHTHDLLRHALEQTFTIHPDHNDNDTDNDSGDPGGGAGCCPSDPSDSDAVTDTLLNILGVDIPNAVIAISGDEALYATRSASTDTTILASFAAEANTYDDNGNLVFEGHDREARNLKRTTTRRDKSEYRTGFKFEAVVATCNIALNRTAPARNSTRLPGTAFAYRFHNQNHSGEETIKTLRIVKARGRHLDTLAADLAYTGYLPEKWAIPLRDLGIDPVQDLIDHSRSASGRITHRSEQRGLRALYQRTNSDGDPAQMLVTIDGTIFEKHIGAHLKTVGMVDLAKPEWVVTANQSPERAKARKDLIELYDLRAKLAWREHDRPTADTWRVKGPAYGSSRSAWCQNWPKTIRDGQKRRLPKMPCKPTDDCMCGSVITLPDTANARLRQRRAWGSLGWQNAYAQRNLAESHFATIRGNYNDLDRPLNIRTSGVAARGIATLCIFAAMNARLIARHRSKRGQQPHPPLDATPAPDRTPTAKPSKTPPTQQSPPATR